MKYCHKCGAGLDDRAQFCKKCGARQRVTEENSETGQNVKIEQNGRTEQNKPAGSKKTVIAVAAFAVALVIAIAVVILIKSRSLTSEETAIAETQSETAATELAKENQEQSETAVTESAKESQEQEAAPATTTVMKETESETMLQETTEAASPAQTAETSSADRQTGAEAEIASLFDDGAEESRIYTYFATWQNGQYHSLGEGEWDIRNIDDSVSEHLTFTMQFENGNSETFTTKAYYGERKQKFKSGVKKDAEVYSFELTFGGKEVYLDYFKEEGMIRLTDADEGTEKYCSTNEMKEKNLKMIGYSGRTSEGNPFETERAEGKLVKSGLSRAEIDALRDGIIQTVENNLYEGFYVFMTGDSFLDVVMKKVGYSDYYITCYYDSNYNILCAELQIDGNSYIYYYNPTSEGYQLIYRIGPDGAQYNPETNEFMNQIIERACMGVQ